jgi:hypothetical protein
MDVKEDYNVDVLPTILIINSQGAVQKRLIGQKDPSGLMSELGLDYEDNDNGDTVFEEPQDEKPSKDKRSVLWCVGGEKLVVRKHVQAKIHPFLYPSFSQISV